MIFPCTSSFSSGISQPCVLNRRADRVRLWHIKDLVRRAATSGQRKAISRQFTLVACGLLLVWVSIYIYIYILMIPTRIISIRQNQTIPQCTIFIHHTWRGSWLVESYHNIASTITALHMLHNPAFPSAWHPRTWSHAVRLTLGGDDRWRC